MKRNNKKGFTIVELVVVIAVIAILAAVLIPNLSRLVTKANDSATMQNAESALKTMLLYQKDGALEDNTVFKVGDTYFIYANGKLDAGSKNEPATLGKEVKKDTTTLDVVSGSVKTTYTFTAIEELGDVVVYLQPADVAQIDVITGTVTSAVSDSTPSTPDGE